MTKHRLIADSPDWFAERTWNVQPKPYVHPQAYEFFQNVLIARQGTTTSGQNRWPRGTNGAYGVTQGATIKAVSQFLGQVSDTMEGMTNALEFDQAFQMMAKRANQLRNFGKALNSLDFPGAWKALFGSKPSAADLKRMRDRWSKDRHIADLWLELHFGWEPLWKDIQGAVQVVSNPAPKPQRVKARASDQRDVDESINPPLGYGSMGQVWSLKSSLQIGAFISVTNPNAFMAAQLGLTNPLLSIVQHASWSFVLNWFTNLDQFLSQYDQLLGATVTDAYSTLLEHGVRKTSVLQGPGWIDSDTVQGCWCRREVGLPPINLSIRPIRVLSVVRAATAVSLLVQQLPRGRHRT